MTMLLKQLIESPITSSKLLVCDPFQEFDQEDLVKEVIGLANADVDGPRNILFGINPGGIDGGRVVGIDESAMADLKTAHRTISALVEPFLHLAFIFDRINGKLVGALEIDGCEDKPYIVGKNFSEQLSRGQCWVRDGRDLSGVQPADLARPNTPEPAKTSAKKGKPPSITVGFNEQPDCVLLETDVPDTSSPPFAEETGQGKQSPDLKKTIKEKLGTVTTRILRLGGKKKDSDNKGNDEVDGAETVLADANNHYFFEEKALHLNFCVCNEGSDGLENVSIKLGFPLIPDFDVVDRLYFSPFDKRSQHSSANRGYPNIERCDDGIYVRSTMDLLTPESPTQAFKSALRVAVGPKMKGRKLAVVYSLRGPDSEPLGEGRLKIKFGKMSA